MKSILRMTLLSMIAFFILTTCDSPMGMGKQIDFEPPVLTLEPKPPTPLYVRLGTTISGTVTDNEAVDKVILVDSTTREQLFTATLLPGNRWQISLVFTAEQNGQTILADVVAYDKAGNSGAESIASIVLRIDIKPPIVEDIWIQRTSVKTADLEDFFSIKDLERSDPNGEQNVNINRYQNGAFNIKAKLAENETRIDNLTLIFYDSEYPDTELLRLAPESGSSVFNPQWFVTENMILDAGDSKLPVANYKGEYINNDKRYYYRLRVSAVDMSGNESGISSDEENRVIIEDQGYLCLWQKADYPKGILDPLVVGAGTEIVTIKGSSLPVEFFDDDKVDWAYAALFTKEQWLGDINIAPGYALPKSNDNAKFEALLSRLRAGEDVYNWRYDSSRSKTSPDSEPVGNLLTAPADEKIHYLITGNDPADFGEFVVVTLVKDVKQPPHNSAEFPDVVKFRKYDVTLVDENAPVIVFDKVGGSPEENTFPTIDAAGNFRIHGYTYREDKGRLSLNEVKKFRIAWIPFAIATENNISAVRTALGLEKIALANSDFPAGVQWWDISAAVTGGLPEEREWDTIAGSDFRKQNFEKTFNVLGGKDDLKPSEYDNFHYNGELENTTKLFIFFAEDNMGHQVYSQFYLLGNKTPPTIKIYDITDRITMTSPPAPNVYDHNPLGEITQDYIDERADFNKDSYTLLRSVSTLLGEGDKAETYRAYPRGTIIKFWAKAETNGDLALADIKMEDITYELVSMSDKYPELGFYNDSDSALSYAEYFPEVSQRVFLFTATDSLGNIARVQRTIAIANAATLTSITTAEQNGTYPSGKTIELRANFDGMIKLENNTNGTRPRLNVLYKIGSTDTAQQIECDPVDNTNGQLFLIFKFNVPVNAGDQLRTIYAGISNNPGILDRPITVTSSNKILDFVRGDAAYTPGNVTGFTWKDAAHSLQYDAGKNPNGKNIRLDGVVPVITVAAFKDIKEAASPNNYYFKSGESLSIELTSTKPLKVSGDASLQFRLQKPDNSYTTYNTTAFEYRKMDTGNKIIFTLDVSKANIQNEDHGRLMNVTLYSAIAANITDDPGNPVDVTSFNTQLNTLLPNTLNIRFDLVAPKKPVIELTPTGGGPSDTIGATPNVTKNYNKAHYFSFNNAPTTEEPYGISKRQYSLDGGLNWAEFPNPRTDWTTTTIAPDPVGFLYISNGQWNFKTRYVDLAGNEGETTDQLIYINNKFPTLLEVKASQPNATYIAGQRLDFTLDFDDVVNVPATGVILTIADTTSTTNVPGGNTPPSYNTVLTATQIANSRTVTFTWNLVANTKDMPNGLRITALNITGLTDRFGNSGPTAAATDTTVTLTGQSAVTYASGTNTTITGIKVSTIRPTVRSREPQNANNRTGNITVFTADPDTVASSTVAKGSISDDNKTIKLNFSKAVQKGNGTITIRPHAGYAIPAVFEHEGYYVTYTYDTNGNVTGETRSSTATTNSTYVSGFYDVFNSINNTQRNTLIGGTLMSAPALSNITGLSVGPYQKTTNGLTQGAGYTGYYGNPATQGAATIALPGNNAPGTRGTNYMIPDLETKWVLAYQYDNLFDTAAGVVTNIRAVLDSAKWRWQEIAVTNTSVVISGNTVTITLSEPLLPGLQWDLSYPEGTFTDLAGNTAVGETRGNYWFWSKGTQKPVIRADRKSYDARPGGTTANYSGDSFSNGSTYNATGYNGTIASFETIAYKITSETPQARLFQVTLEGKNFTGNGNGSVTGAWTGNAVTATPAISITANANILWQGPKTGIETIGVWAKPNLIFRSHTDGQYYIMEDGMNISKNISGVRSNGNPFGDNNNNNRFYGFRSFNRDATYTELNGLTVPNTNATAFSAYITGNFTYASYEASKNYVVAQARIDHVNTGGTYSTANAVSSQKGFEGVFRTVVMINNDGLTNAGTNGGATWTATTMPMLINGTNVRSGLPTVSGFPLKDGVHRSDSRYVKVFNRTDKHFYWVTTEIVSAWFIQTIGNGAGSGSYSRSGDVEDWLSAGYGDLVYALNFATH